MEIILHRYQSSYQKPGIIGDSHYRGIVDILSKHFGKSTPYPYINITAIS